MYIYNCVSGERNDLLKPKPIKSISINIKLSCGFYGRVFLVLIDVMLMSFLKSNIYKLLLFIILILIVSLKFDYRYKT